MPSVRKPLHGILSDLTNIVLSQYVFRMAGRLPTAWEQKGVAVAGYTVAVICKFLGCLGLLKLRTDGMIVGVTSNRLSLMFSDAVGFVKLGTLVLLVVLSSVLL